MTTGQRAFGEASASSELPGRSSRWATVPHVGTALALIAPLGWLCEIVLVERRRDDEQVAARLLVSSLTQN